MFYQSKGKKEQRNEKVLGQMDRDRSGKEDSGWPDPGLQFILHLHILRCVHIFYFVRYTGFRYYIVFFRMSGCAEGLD